jgi:hypothetical protein
MPPSSVVTLEDLRRKFWWLGPSLRDSYIVALDGDTVTIKVIQCSWNRRTQKYEEAVARDFLALGLQVVWKPFFSEKLRAEMEKAREEALKAKISFDEGRFLNEQREAEQRREARGR